MSNKSEEIIATIENLKRVIRAIKGYSKNAHQLTCMTEPQILALEILSSSNPLRVSDLAKHMSLHSATVIGIIDRLEVKGLITRTRSRGDRRVVDVSLTKTGQETLEQTQKISQEMFLKGLEGLSDEQFSLVSAGMHLMSRVLELEQGSAH